MKLMFLNGSRGEWGYIRPIIDESIKQGIDYDLVATNMMLMSEHGYLVAQLESQGYKIADKIQMAFSETDHFSFAKSMSVLLMSLVETIRRERPSWLILAGDRGEQLVGAIAGAYTYTPVAHIQAGERSGNIDGVARHAIGKLVHLHFASNEDAGERLRKLGEEEKRIFCVGAPQLDEIINAHVTTLEKLNKKFDMNLKNKPLLCVFHPVTEELNEIEKQTENLLTALNENELQKICIMPNNDAGGRIVRRVIQDRRRSDSKIFDNLDRADYLGLLKNCSAIVGNSSSGLLEAPSFETPCVNLGRRQANRVQGQNVLNGGFAPDEIKTLVQKATSNEFKASLKGTKNPYGDGRSSKRILSILKKTKIDQNLLIKDLTY